MGPIDPNKRPTEDDLRELARQWAAAAEEAAQLNERAADANGRRDALHGALRNALCANGYTDDARRAFDAGGFAFFAMGRDVQCYRTSAD